MNNIKVQENSATGRFPVLGIAAIALFLRLLLAWITPLEKAFDDVYFFILPWMQNMHHNGVLAMYQEAAGAAWAMDYPPLYYLSLYFTTGKFAAIAADAGKTQLAYFLCRAFPCIVDSVFVGILAKLDRRIGWTWCFCLPALMDTGMMAQSDCLLVFLLFLMFYFFIEKENLTAVSLIYAVIACTKLQGLYILPIFLLMLSASTKTSKEKIKSFTIGVIAGIVFWLPWIILEGVEKFFGIYLGSYSHIKILASNTGNIFFLNSICILPNIVPAEYNTLYMIATFAFLAICVFALIKTYKITENILFSSFLYMFFIYMFTLQQHERYEIYAVGIAVFGMYWLKEFKSIVPIIIIAAAAPMASLLFDTILEGQVDASLSAYIIALASIVAFGENLFVLLKTLKLKNTFREKGEIYVLNKR